MNKNSQTLENLKSLREKYENGKNSPQIFVENETDDSDEEIGDFLSSRFAKRRRSSLPDEMCEENRSRRLENAMHQLTIGNADFITSRNGSIVQIIVSESDNEHGNAKKTKTEKSSRKSNFISNFSTSNHSLNSVNSNDSKASTSLIYSDKKHDKYRPNYQKTTKSFRNRSVCRRLSISTPNLNDSSEDFDDDSELPPLPGLPTVLAPIWSAPKARDSLSVKTQQQQVKKHEDEKRENKTRAGEKSKNWNLKEKLGEKQRVERQDSSGSSKNGSSNTLNNLQFSCHF